MFLLHAEVPFFRLDPKIMLIFKPNLGMDKKIHPEPGLAVNFFLE